MKSGWIQVGSKKPKEGQCILGFDSHLPRHPFIYIYRKGHWYLVDEEHFEGCNVTHWMPLPDKPSKV